MGGMSAFIPSKDEAVNKKAFEQVTADKEREAGLGYDGTWVAHPKLVDVARNVFDRKLGDKPNQKSQLREEVTIVAEQLLDVDAEHRVITEEGVRKNINVAILYIDSWLRGIGAAALNNLMEDAATAEISRAQLWQWIHHDVTLQDGSLMTEELYLKLRTEEYLSICKTLQSCRTLQIACVILDGLVLNEEFEDFLTIKAYEYLENIN
jgi:malate synthase